MRELQHTDIENVDGAGVGEALTSMGAGAAAGARVGGYFGPQATAVGTIAGAAIGLALYLW